MDQLIVNIISIKNDKNTSKEQQIQIEVDDNLPQFDNSLNYDEEDRGYLIIQII